MTRARRDRVLVTCSCGCGRLGERRGSRGYIRACYERWRRAGQPAAGPPPAPTPTTDQGAAERRRVEALRRRWAAQVADDVALGRAPAPGFGWEDSAGCRDAGFPLNAWFSTGPVPEQLVAVCDACPVRAECLTAALTRREKHGIWGGQSPDELKHLRRRMTRTRSAVRKDSAA